MTINQYLTQLEEVLTNIESLTLKMQNYNHNADTASAAAAATYILTSSSNNKTIKTFGQIGAITGFLYSSNQRQKANSIELNVIQNISSGIIIMESGCIALVRSEKDIYIIKKYLELTLRIGRSLDPIIEKYISKVNYTGILGEKNQDFLMKINNVDVFNLKLRFNDIINGIDKMTKIKNPENNYFAAIRQIDKSKLIKEGFYVRGLILLFILVGFFIFQKNEIGGYVVLAGIGLWIINHLYPFGKESAKLKRAVNLFCAELAETTKIQKLTLR